MIFKFYSNDFEDAAEIIYDFKRTAKYIKGTEPVKTLVKNCESEIPDLVKEVPQTRTRKSQDALTQKIATQQQAMENQAQQQQQAMENQAQQHQTFMNQMKTMLDEMSKLQASAKEQPPEQIELMAKMNTVLQQQTTATNPVPSTSKTADDTQVLKVVATQKTDTQKTDTQETDTQETGTQEENSQEKQPKQKLTANAVNINKSIWGFGHVVMVELSNPYVVRVPFLLPSIPKQRPDTTLMFQSKYDEIKDGENLGTPVKTKDIPESMRNKYSIGRVTNEVISIEPTFSLNIDAKILLVTPDSDKLVLEEEAYQNIEICGIIGNDAYNKIDNNVKYHDDPTKAGYDTTDFNRWKLRSNLGKQAWLTDSLEDVGNQQVSARPKLRPSTSFSYFSNTEIWEISSQNTDSTQCIASDEEENQNTEGIMKPMSIKELKEIAVKRGQIMRSSRPMHTQSNTMKPTNPKRKDRANSSDRRSTSGGETEADTESSDGSRSASEEEDSDGKPPRKPTKNQKTRDKKKLAMEAQNRMKMISNSKDGRRRSWSPSHRQMRAARKLPMLDKFSGKNNFISFKYCFEKMAVEEGWWTEKQYLKHNSILKDRLFDYLKDDALEFALNIGKKASYKSIMEKLNTVYGNLAQKNLAMIQLGAMKQTEDLTVADFYGAILRKAQEAYAGEDIENTPSIQSTLTTTFLHGIRDKKAAFHVINTQAPNLIYKAFVAVTKYQENRDALTTAAVGKRAVRRTKPEYDLETDESELSEDEISVKYARAFKNKNERSRFMKKVSFLAQQAEQELPSQKKEGRAERDQCHYCLKSGHFISNCPLKNEDEEKRIIKILELYRKSRKEAEKTESPSTRSAENHFSKKPTLRNDKNPKQENSYKVKKTQIETDEDEDSQEQQEIYESGKSDLDEDFE